MTDEAAIDILKNIFDGVIDDYCVSHRCEHLCKNQDCYLSQSIDIVLNLVETLIKRNKELEEKCRKYSIVEIAYQDIIEDSMPKEIINRDYIPKSVIKEKIEEIKNNSKQNKKRLIGQDIDFENPIYLCQIKVLEELLEEEN
jgi:hypothetical protein